MNKQDQNMFPIFLLSIMMMLVAGIALIYVIGSGIINLFK